jgi:hypothetical protein
MYWSCLRLALKDKSPLSEGAVIAGRECFLAPCLVTQVPHLVHEQEYSDSRNVMLGADRHIHHTILSKTSTADVWQIILHGSFCALAMMSRLLTMRLLALSVKYFN